MANNEPDPGGDRGPDGTPSVTPPSIKSKPPRRTISGSLALDPEILKMKQAQKEAQEKAERILKRVTTHPPPSIPDDR